MNSDLKNIDITQNQHQTILDLLKHYIPNTKVWAYGSRVKFCSTPKSDLDMVAFTSPKQRLAISDLREAFEESNLPFRVDLFVWDEVPEQFRKQIEEKRSILQDCPQKTSGKK